MGSFEFDNVKAEKEDALWRYNMENKLKRLRLTGIFLALFLLSWSWFSILIPGTLEVAGDFIRRFVSTFNKPLFTFVLLNFIIFVVYILSSQKQTQKQATSCTDIYDEYVGSSRRIIPTSAVSTAAEESIVGKRIVHVENAVPQSPVKKLETTVDTVREPNISVSPVKQPTKMTNRTVTTKTKPVVSSTEVEEKKYQRSQSMVLECRNRRSERTAIGVQELVFSGIEPPRRSMNEMSSEEFQLIIDSFIAERKKTLLQENTGHYTKTLFI